MGGSVIKNINIEGTIDSNDNISNYIGILAGINYGKIKNCNVGGSIKVNGNGRTDPIYIGGFVSQNVGEICYSNSSSKVIKNLFANVNIERTGVKQITSMYAGGIIGSSSPSNGKLYNSYAKGSVKCNVITKNRKFSYIGGIVANASNMEIDNCYSLMNTDEAKDNSNKMKKGGIAGCVDNTIITYCYKK